MDERQAPADPVARFDDLFRSLYRELYGLAYRQVGDRQEAEDVLQEVFLKLSSADVLGRPDDEVRAWLRRVCLNVGHNRVRAGRRAEHHVERAARLAVMGEVEGAPLPGVLRLEEQRAVRAALAALPERQRACLLLRHSGYSYTEVAAALGVAAGSVGVILSRAEKAFRISYENLERQP